MAQQESNHQYYTNEQKNILDLEKKYMDILEHILSGDYFKSRLRDLFITLDVYSDDIQYKGASIVNSPVERLVIHCIYRELYRMKYRNQDDSLELECYPFPECGDIAIQFDDAIISIDVKTANINNNSSDITTLTYRSNQSSFVNVISYPQSDGYGGFTPLIEIDGNIEMEYNNVPVLTYITRILYVSDKKSNSKVDLLIEPYKECESVNLFCIPNGYLDNLFDYDIIHGIKTYKYYDESDKSGYYKPIYINIDNCKKIEDCIGENITKVYDYLFSGIDNRIDDKWVKGNNSNYIVLIDTGHLGDKRHEEKGTLWTLTQKDEKLCMRAIEKTSTCRIDWKKNLVVRYDSEGREWLGVRQIHVY